MHGDDGRSDDVEKLMCLQPGQILRGERIEGDDVIRPFELRCEDDRWTETEEQLLWNGRCSSHNG